MNAKYRVMIVDDHPHAREGVRMILGMDPDFEIMAEAASGEEALELVQSGQPDLILMDINMPGASGLETTKVIKSSFPQIKIIMMTVSDDVTHLFEALKKGAQGYLLKNLRPADWHPYIKGIMDDEAPMSSEIASHLLKEFTTANPIKETTAEEESLTLREREILECVARGQSNKEIAESLFISENTVKNHLKNIMQKLHLQNRVQLTRYAYEKGILGN